MCRTDAREVQVGSSYAVAMTENMSNDGVDRFLGRVIGAVVLSIVLLKRRRLTEASTSDTLGTRHVDLQGLTGPQPP